MRLTRIEIFTAILLLSFPLGLCAQTDSELRKHVIIIYDNYIPNKYQKLWRDIPQKLDSLLSSFVMPKLSEKDYISVVNYGLGTGDNSFDSYTTNTVAWETYATFSRNLRIWNYWDWRHVMRHSNEGEKFSLLTGAKFYALHALYNKNDGKAANKVYILDITDEQYNGNDDYKAEFNRFLEKQIELGYETLNYNEYRRTILAVSNNYEFTFIKDTVLMRGSEKPYKASLFEITPSNPNLKSVIDYPYDLGLKRVPGGFRVSPDYRIIDSTYQIRKIQAFSVCGNDTIDRATKIEKGKTVGDSIKVVFKAWLEPKDTIFSGLVLSPYDENFRSLTVTVNLPLPERKKILGFIPLYDWMWWLFPNDADSMVAIWTGVLIFLLCMLVTYILRKIIIAKSSYTPDDHSINISHT